MQHFTFIASFCLHIIAFDLTPIQKGQLTMMVQKSFLWNPTIGVIGFGYNDELMMQAADVSIELVHKKFNK